MWAAFRPFGVTRVRAGHLVEGTDHAATEEPLEIRLHGRAFAVIMRTPGADRELAAGFLLAERVLKSADDLGAIEYCTDGPPEGGHDVPDGPAEAGRHVRDETPAENIVNVT